MLEIVLDVNQGPFFVDGGSFHFRMFAVHAHLYFLPWLGFTPDIKTKIGESTEKDRF